MESVLNSGSHPVEWSYHSTDVVVLTSHQGVGSLIPLSSKVFDQRLVL